MNNECVVLAISIIRHPSCLYMFLQSCSSHPVKSIPGKGGQIKNMSHEAWLFTNK